MTATTILRRLSAGLAALALALPAAAQTVPDPIGSWRVVSSASAPWVRTSAADKAALRLLRGKTLRFDAERVVAPRPLGCDQARYEFLAAPAPGLFQGGLPAPAERNARKVGIGRLPAPTMQVACSSGLFDFHLTGNGTMVTALDNVIWTLKPERGEGAGTPDATMRRLMLEHMAGDMGFTRASVARKDEFLTRGLRRAIARYFAKDLPKDEPPPINGDPFTNAQEYPHRFALGPATIEGDAARLSVTFTGEGFTRIVTADLKRARQRWLVNDLRYEDGVTLRDLLK